MPDDNTADEMSRIDNLLYRLEDKINSLDTHRTSPEAISDSFSGRMQGYLGGLFNIFTRNKDREEDEARKPRSIVQQAIPIDVVSITPTAASQIVTALEAAGIGKYNLDIEQKIIEPDDEGGLIASIIAMVGSVVAWTAGFLGSLLGALGAFLVARFSGMMAFMRGKLGLILKAVALLGALETFGITDFTDMDDELFDGAKSALASIATRATSSPEALFRQSPPSLTAAIDSSDVSQYSSHTDMEALLDDEESGPKYASNLLRGDGRNLAADTTTYQAMKQQTEVLGEFIPEENKHDTLSGLSHIIRDGGNVDDIKTLIGDNIDYEKYKKQKDAMPVATEEDQTRLAEQIAEQFEVYLERRSAADMLDNIIENPEDQFGDYITDEENLTNELSPAGLKQFEKDKETLSLPIPDSTTSALTPTQSATQPAPPLLTAPPSSQPDLDHLLIALNESNNSLRQNTDVLNPISGLLGELANKVTPLDGDTISSSTHTDTDLPGWDDSRRSYIS